MFGNHEQEELVLRARENGIDRIVVSSLGQETYLPYPSVDEIYEANSDVLALMKRFPEYVYGLGYINPRNANWREELLRCIGEGMIGIKLWISARASDPLVFPVVEECISSRVIVLQHSSLNNRGNLQDESTPFDVACLGRRYSEADIIMAHAGGNQQAGLKAIADLPNVYTDVSGGYPERGIVEKAVSLLGAKRIIFGSDAPGRSYAVQLAKVSSSQIGTRDKKLILGDNFMELLNDDRF
ncbi:MAG: amidohydrolase family protein [bacterium]|nr:amidohydrolase family protein [bacterium]